MAKNKKGENKKIYEVSKVCSIASLITAAIVNVISSLGVGIFGYKQLLFFDQW